MVSLCALKTFCCTTLELSKKWQNQKNVHLQRGRTQFYMQGNKPTRALCSTQHCIYETQFASLSPSEEKTCWLAEETRKAPCHMACTWLSEECQTTVGGLGRGSCLPVTQGTKVPSRCSGAQSSV